MKVSRRNFLFGSAATLGVIALAPYLEPIVFHGAGYKKRVISSMSIGGTEDGDEPIRVSLRRWPTGTALFCVSVHPKSAYRWWLPPGREPIFTDKSLMLLDATGCPSQVEIAGYDDGVWFVEKYHFPSRSKERLS